MALATDQDFAAFDLLEVAFEAEVGIAHRKQLGVDAPMGGMASRATFAHRLVLEHIRPALGGMALQTVFLLREHLRAAARMRDPLVRRMTKNAGHPAFGHGMVAGQFKLPAHIHVAGVANGFLRP